MEEASWDRIWLVVCVCARAFGCAREGEARTLCTESMRLSLRTGTV